MQAWEKGRPSAAEIADDSDAAAPRPTDALEETVQFTSVPRQEVQVLEDGWHRWRGFKVQAIDFDDAVQLLNEDWREQQLRHAVVSRRAKLRREEALQSMARDSSSRLGPLVSLEHPRYKEVFKGRLTENGSSVTFVEEGTWLRVTVTVPPEKDAQGRGTAAWRDEHLYNAMRGERAKANRKATVATRRRAVADQLPQGAGDLEVKGRKETGQLTYSWNGYEVPVTPRERRQDLPHDASRLRQTRARETTPERALRKITEKVKRSLMKAARGEHEAIVARAEPGGISATHGAGAEAQGHPAIEKLNDPIVLSHLRAAYTFLGSARLHYCKNCDEEWVVFDEEFPQSGVSCAGTLAGQCETIARAGYTAAAKEEDLCSRCAKGSVHAKMYSAENLQHLGPRYAPLSNLTWYESLLIARVHPVISVVTLTSTGMLCYAGHVCNYYVKVMEWFKGLPGILRDENGFS